MKRAVKLACSHEQTGYDVLLSPLDRIVRPNNLPRNSCEATVKRELKTARGPLRPFGCL